MIARLVLAALVAAPAAQMPPSTATPATSPSAAPAVPATSPSAAATPAGSSAPAGSPAPATAPASTTPAPAPFATVAATPSPYKYRFVPRYAANRASDEPQIFAVYLNSRQLRSLGPIHIKVETTPNVVKVVSRSNGRDGIVPLVSPGDFEATSTLPKIPFIAAGMTLDLEFVATTAAGKKSVVRVPVQLN